MSLTDYYTLDDDDPNRIAAVDREGIEICGAYRPAGHDYWQFYITQSTARMADVTVPPHREHFCGQNGGYVAKQWIVFIANLHSLAVQARQRVS